MIPKTEAPAGAGGASEATVLFAGDKPEHNAPLNHLQATPLRRRLSLTLFIARTVAERAFRVEAMR
jgi:hypothetical protein